MPKSNNVQIDPAQVPEFEPPTSAQDIVLAEKTAILNYTESTFERQLAQIIALPNTLTKAQGLLDAAKIVKVNRDTLSMMLAEIAHAINSEELYLLFPGNAYTNPREFWEDGVGTSYGEIKQLLDFYFDVRPVLEAVGVNPDKVFAASTPIKRQAMRQAAKQITRQLPKDPKNPDKPPILSDDVKQQVRENILVFQEMPDSQVKEYQRVQKGIEPSKPIYVNVQLRVNGGRVEAVPHFPALGEDDVERLKDHQAYLVYQYNGNRTDWSTLHTLMRNKAALIENERGVVESTLADTEEDDTIIFGDEEEEAVAPRPLKRSRI